MVQTEACISKNVLKKKSSGNKLSKERRGQKPEPHARRPLKRKHARDGHLNAVGQSSAKRHKKGDLFAVKKQNNINNMATVRTSDDTNIKGTAVELRLCLNYNLTP
jgi:hypothetical protein